MRDEQTKILAERVAHLKIEILDRDFDKKGFHAILMVDDPEKLPQLAEILLDMQYFVGFVTACHTDPDIEVLYQFARHDINHRIMVQCAADKENGVPSISSIYQGADWHERETRDFFGVHFSGHPNMAPLILDESDTNLKPLLKNEKTIKSKTDIFRRNADDE